MADVVVKVRMKDLLSGPWQKTGKTFRAVSARMAQTVTGVTNTIFSLKGAILGLGAVALGKSFIEAGSSMEKFRTQLWAISGQNEEMANQTLAWVRKFGEITPFTTSEVVEAFVQMRAVGIKVTKDMMATIGDTAYAMNKDIRDVSMALISGETEVLRKLGITLKRAGDKAEIMSDGMKLTVGNNMAEIQQAILAVWGPKFKGAMKRAEKDWSGMVSLFKSQWYEFQVAVMEKGVFDFMKTGLKAVGDEIAKMQKQGKIGDLITEGADLAIATLKLFIKTIHWIYKGIKGIEMVVGGLKVGIYAFSYAIAEAMTVWIQGFRDVALAYNATVGQILGEVGLGDILKYEKRITKWADIFKQKMYESSDSIHEMTESIRESDRTVTAFIEVLDKAVEKGRAAAAMSELRAELTGLYAEWNTLVAEGGLVAGKEVAREINIISAKIRGLVGGVEFEGWREGVEDVQKAAEKVNITLGATKDIQAKITDSVKDEAVVRDKRAVARAVKETNDNLEKQIKLWCDVKDKTDEVSAAGKQWNETVQGVADIVSTHLMNAFDKLLDGEVTRMRDMVRDILRDVSRMAVQMAVKSAMNVAMSFVLAAEGAVFKGGLGQRFPMRALGSGGKTSGPEVALIGEGRDDELVVPIPGGKVPVEINGGRGGGGASPTYNITIQANDAASFEAQLSRSDSHLMAQINQAFMNNPSFGRT